ncbi:Uncharacterized protein dnm_079150 [Desulfonema magnum]|uniref:Uncharacterized protein n=1 Tax=Desulfonema magnum TaxID=45655 RepID=A0A975GS98_9BACT|nr:Uncharacterized protein dnm_079150 [Desulfonema magnum]
MTNQMKKIWCNLNRMRIRSAKILFSHSGSEKNAGKFMDRQRRWWVSLRYTHPAFS